MQLISLLKSTFLKADITIKQSHGDANVMICKIALELAEEEKAVQVSGTDTDLLVIPMYHWKENMKLFFRTIFKTDIQHITREKVMWWNISDLVASKPSLRNFVLFAHIWGECDTRSAMHQQGVYRLNYFDLLIRFASSAVQNLATTFHNAYASPTEIGSAGCEIMLKM